ncbi:MAG TPA: hypothetical protein VFQ45_11965 [Longimicrobium sp.]|nr:hypothetical protein [Longimicrobium sp.]
MATNEEKKFDAVRLMRELRDKISRDLEGMSYEEELAYLRQGRERYLAKKESKRRGEAA